MVELTTISALAGAELPRMIGTVTISEEAVGPVTSISPFVGTRAKLSSRLKSKVGLSLPENGKSAESAAARLFWTGLNQWFLAGVASPDLAEIAAVTDQSDGWVAITIRGSGAAKVMARLGPLDYAEMSVGDVARSELAHMMSIQIAHADGFEVWIMRSFARTALAHVIEAASSEAAIKSLQSKT